CWGAAAERRLSHGRVGLPYRMISAVEPIGCGGSPASHALAKRLLRPRNLLIALAAIVVAVLLWRLALRGDEAPALVTAPVVVGDVERTVLATGTLEPSELVSVGAQVSGQVVRLAVELGDRVQRGD